MRGTNIELTFVELDGEDSQHDQAASPPSGPGEDLTPTLTGADAHSEGKVGGDGPALSERHSAFVEAIVHAVDRRLDERFHGDYRWVEGMGGPERVADRMVAAVPTIWVEGFPHGLFYTTSGLAKWRGVSRQAVHKWAKAGRVLAIERGNRLLYPHFQFGTFGEPLPGLPEVVKLLTARGLSEWDQIMWFATPATVLGDHSPAHQLRIGEPLAVVDFAAERAPSPTSPRDDSSGE